MRVATTRFPPKIFVVDYYDATQQHLLQTWDTGAIRTVYAYFHINPPSVVEKFLWKYFYRYCRVVEEGSAVRYVWSDRNPSACAVALCRECFWGPLKPDYELM